MGTTAKWIFGLLGFWAVLVGISEVGGEGGAEFATALATVAMGATVFTYGPKALQNLGFNAPPTAKGGGRVAIQRTPLMSRSIRRK